MLLYAPALYSILQPAAVQPHFSVLTVASCDFAACTEQPNGCEEHATACVTWVAQHVTVFVCTLPSDGYFIDNGVATECSFCASGTYQTAACTPSSDTTCNSCTAVQNAGTGSTVTCTSDTDSRVTGCAPGYAVQTGAAGEMDTCVACIPDTYKQDNTAGPCTTCTADSTTSGSTGNVAASDCLCLPGYYYIGFLQQCRPCDADTYKDTIANAACTSCPANSDTDGHSGRTAVDQCICGPGHRHSVTLENATFSSSCVSCATGRYKDIRANQDCTACPANSFSSEGSATRAACLCNAGFTGSLATAGSSCALCPSAAYKDSSGDADCDSCPQNSNTEAGSVSSSIAACSCDSGYTGQLVDTSSVCTACPSGQSYDDATRQCGACDAGTYQDFAAQTDCIECLPGRYQSEPGQSSCAECSTGTFSATASTSCSSCGLGQVDDDSDPSTPCVSCPIGQYSGAEMTNCTVCAAGRADLDSNPATVCDACGVGHYAAAGVTVCTACAAGEFDGDSDASTPCESCDMGSYSPAGSIACNSCPAGFHDNDQDPSTPCDGDASACTAGHYANEGSHTCDTCAAGYADLDGSSATPCQACGAGTYTAEGFTSCAECAAGTVDHDSDASTQCVSCVAGEVSTAGTTECLACHARSCPQSVQIMIADSTSIDGRSGRRSKLSLRSLFVLIVAARPVRTPLR